MNKPVIAVTGMSAVDSPAPGVPVLRSLKQSSLNPTLVGLSYGVLEPGNFMPDLLCSSYIIPYPSSGAAALLDRIAYIHKEQPLDAIVATLDSELENFISIQEPLRNMGIKMFLPQRESLRMRDKSLLNETLADSGTLLPETYSVQDTDSIKQVMEKLTYPVLIKGLFYEAYLARSYEEAAGFFHRVAMKWGLPVLIQQFIAGEEYNVAALARGGEMLGAVAMKKLFVTDKGKAWAGVTIRTEQILDQARAILRHVKWDSGCELEFIVDAKTGKPYLLEMNPRYPAWIHLATAAGQNMPEMLVRLALGEDVKPVSDYSLGTVFVRHSWDDILPMSAIESLSVKGELKNLNGKGEAHVR